MTCLKRFMFIFSILLVGISESLHANISVWNHLHDLEGQYGGQRRVFQFTNDLEALRNAELYSFPATQFTPHRLNTTFSDSLLPDDQYEKIGLCSCFRCFISLIEGSKWRKKFRIFAQKILKPMGYQLEKTIDSWQFTAPDIDEISGSWESIVGPIIPNGLDVKIVSQEGFANPEEFIESFIAGEWILSQDIEFVHDQMLHIMRLLWNLYQYGENFSDVYMQARNRVKEIYGQLLRGKKALEKPSTLRQKIVFARLTETLSAWIDEMTTEDAPVYKIILEKGFSHFALNLQNGSDQHKLWYDYLERTRIPMDQVKNQEIEKMLKWLKISHL